MSRRMLLEDDINNDGIVLCKDFSPNGKQFYLWQDEPIYLNENELYININLNNSSTSSFQEILCLGEGNIMSWVGNIIHFYYQPTSGILRFQIANVLTVDKVIDKTQDLEINVTKNAVYLNDELFVLFSTNTKVDNMIKNIFYSKNISIGCSGHSSNFIYNLVQLQPYKERS